MTRLMAGSLRIMGVRRSEGGLLLLLAAKLIQLEANKESMFNRFLTSTVKRPLVMDLAAELTYFQASWWSIRKSPCLMRRMMEATESSLLLPLLLVELSDLVWEPKKGDLPLSIVYCKEKYWLKLSENLDGKRNDSARLRTPSL